MKSPASLALKATLAVAFAAPPATAQRRDPATRSVVDGGPAAEARALARAERRRRKTEAAILLVTGGLALTGGVVGWRGERDELDDFHAQALRGVGLVLVVNGTSQLLLRNAVEVELDAVPSSASEREVADALRRAAAFERRLRFIRRIAGIGFICLGVGMGIAAATHEGYEGRRVAAWGTAAGLALAGGGAIAWSYVPGLVTERLAQPVASRRVGLVLSPTAIGLAGEF